MASSPAEALQKLRNSEYGRREEYTIFIYYLDQDMRHGAVKDPVGALIPCATFNGKQKREAEEAHEKISAMVGSSTVVLARNGIVVPLRLNPSEESMEVTYKEGTPLEKIMTSIVRQRERRKKIEESIQKETDEREDPESMSYLINKVYRAAANFERAEAAQKAADEMRKATEKNTKLVLEYFQRHPEAKSEWQDETRRRLSERNEDSVYTTIVDGMCHIPELRPFVRPVIWDEEQEKFVEVEQSNDKGKDAENEEETEEFVTNT